MTRPIRILQVVGRMDRGGAETWLMHVLQHIDRSRFHFDFLTHTQTKCAYDDEIQALGSSLALCENPKSPWAYRRLLNSRERYDVVHSHLHHYSGFVLRCAAKAKIPARIAHSHSDTQRMDRKASMLRRAYLGVASGCIERYATHGLAASRAAAQALFGPRWGADSRFSVLHCGVDLDNFESDGLNRRDLCQEFGIRADALIFAHIGRFTEAKNHGFLIKIFARIRELEPRAVLLLAGEGELRAEVEQAIAGAGLEDSCRLIGVRNDVPRFLGGCVDALLLPSRWEGLPLVLIESQAAGVPCLCSDVITTEAVEISNLVLRMALAQPVEEWARAALDIAQIRTCRRGSARPLRGTRFDIEVGVDRLEKLYSDSMTPKGDS